MNTPIPFPVGAAVLRRGPRQALGLLTLGALLLGAAPAAEAQTIFGLSGPDLTSLDVAMPNTTQTRVTITGVTAGQTLVGLDFRPATGELFALGYDAATAGANTRLYVLNQTTAVATPVGAAAFRLELGGASERIGFDFNPTVDRIRVVSTNDNNYRLNPLTGGLAATDTNLAFVAGDANLGQNPAVAAAGYTNSFLGTGSTALYYVDEQRSLLLRSDTPNSGTLATVGTISPVAMGTPTPLNAPGASTDLDIYTAAAGNEKAYLSVNQVDGAGNFLALLYTLNLANGATTLVGGVNGTGAGITDIAVRINRVAPAASGQLLYAVSTGNNLLSFYSGTPSFINSSVAITGIATGQTLVGTDFRPNTGQLFGLGYDAATAGNNAQLYIINTSTGVATAVAAATRLELGTDLNGIGFDFNPTVDRIRVTARNRNNYRLNPNTGALAFTDGALNFTDGTAGTPSIGAVAYTNSFPGSTGTALYDLEENLNRLYLQSSPNTGGLVAVSNNPTLPASAGTVNDLDIYFDAAAQLNRAYLVSNADGTTTTSNFSSLYTLSLTTGQATLVDAVGLGIAVRDVAAQLAGANASAALSGRLLYGVAGGNLVSFDSGNPTVIRSAVNITGLPATQVLVGSDFRPATGGLYALGYDAASQTGQLYTLDLATGALTAVGGLQAMALGTTAAAIGFDFNPVPDRIRITSGTTQANLRMSPADATYSTDTPLANPGGTPALTGVAYTNNDNNANTGTAIYGIDQSRSVLATSATPNAGNYTDVGSLGLTLNPALGADFDIYADLTAPSAPANAAFLAAAPAGASTDNLYAVDLGTGTASLLGRIGSGSNLTGLAAFLTPAPVIAAGLVWTGALSTDWGTAGNWSPAQVPTATDNVTIPDVANDPVVSNAQQAANLTLTTGATLTTAPGGTLTVNGAFANNGGTTLGSGTGTVVFAGAAPQTISGSPTFFNNLTAGPAGVVASAPVQVQRLLTLNGNLASGGNLTLLSNATGTAQVLNSGGTVSGNATVQRYITNAAGPTGYRHYAAPVSGSTVSDLATPGFAPVVNPQYNTLGSTVTPFPTVFGYDETRVTTSGSPAPQDFDKGFFSPNALTDALAVGRGYTVQIPATEKVDFVGTLNDGPIAVSGLSRGTQAESGWQLLGNPYPSPIDWDLVARSNVDAAVYVYQPTGPYAGTYRAYVADGANPSPVGAPDQLAVGQGFFVRVTAPGSTNGQVSFSNAARLSPYASPVFNRGASTSPLVRLELRGAAALADETAVYFDPQATAGFDPEYDAYKLRGGSPLLLATETASRLQLAINALPALGAADVVVPVRVEGAAGTYTLSATELTRLPAGRYAYLRDALTGTLTDLAATPTYSFAVAAGAPATGRFSLLLTASRVLATAPAALAQQVVLFPNPASQQVTVALPAQLGRQDLAASLVNMLGQTVKTQLLPAGGAQHTLSLQGLAPGVYTLRLPTAAGLVAKRLVIQ